MCRPQGSAGRRLRNPAPSGQVDPCPRCPLCPCPVGRLRSLSLRRAQGATLQSPSRQAGPLCLRVYRGGCSFGTGGGLALPDSPDLTPYRYPGRGRARKGEREIRRFGCPKRHSEAAGAGRAPVRCGRRGAETPPQSSPPGRARCDMRPRPAPGGRWPGRAAVLGAARSGAAGRDAATPGPRPALARCAPQPSPAFAPGAAGRNAATPGPVR